jgi:hypothetical protein
VIISVIDYINHLTREYPHFRDIWLDWLLFTIACTIAGCLSIYFTNAFAKRLFGRENIVFQSVSIVTGGLIHIYFTGPIFDRLIFGQVTLYFFPTPIIFIEALSIFYVTRLLTYLLNRVAGQPVKNTRSL